jgi:predicted DNA-binding transcriptional regulator AlpA
VRISIDNEEVIDVNEVLRILKIKEYKLYETIKRGEISAPIKPNSRAYWKRSEIEAYLSKSEKTPVSAAASN